MGFPHENDDLILNPSIMNMSNTVTHNASRRKPFALALQLILWAGLIQSCTKDSTPPPPPVPPTYHLTIRDHATGETIRGLKGEAGTVRTENFTSNKFMPNHSLEADTAGSFSLQIGSGRNFVRISDDRFQGVLYELSPQLGVSGYAHTWLDPDGPNVVYSRLLKQEGNDYYFQGDLYHKAYVDLHIVQVSDIPHPYGDSLCMVADLNCTDPAQILNIFQFPRVVRRLAWAPGKASLDTTIRIYGEAAYLNKLSWYVYSSLPDMEGVFQGEDWLGAETYGTKEWTGQGPDTVTRLELRF
jgi:hypothetical protein